MKMKLSFRWYGKDDPISLEYISQIPGMRSIVSAVYDVKPGEVWPEESLQKMKEDCDAHNLVFDVVESIPVHEDIKLGRGDVDHLLQVYCENIRRCAKYGVKCVTYNFMPVFDWTRTQLDKKAPDGSTSLVMYWDQMRGLDPLKDDIHLPGWDSSYTQDEVRELINAYGQIGEEGLWRNSSRPSFPWQRNAAFAWRSIPTILPIPFSDFPASLPMRKIWIGSCLLWTAPPTAFASARAVWAVPQATTWLPWCASTPPWIALRSCTSAT